MKMVEASLERIAPVVVDTAPCKEVILKGNKVDMTIFPMFLHHERDGQSYSDDNLVVSKDPDTGVYDWGFYRSMFRAKNERGFDMTCTSHRARINAQKAAAKGQNLEIAVVIGAPIVDKLAALKGFPPDVDDFEVLGSFYGQPAKLVKCESIDLMVPANAEIVLECELMGTEGWVHDEAPFGEFTGMYGGGLKHNVRALVKAITHRKNGIFQYATIGCGHPWYTDNMLQLPAMEADLFGGCSSKIRILAATAAAGSARDQDPTRKRLHSSSIGGAAHPLPSRRVPLQFTTRMRSKALSPRKHPIRVDSDFDTLDGLLGDDLIYTHSTAQSDTRAEYIALFKKGAFKYLKIERPIENIHVYSDTVVVTGRTTTDAIVDGKPKLLNSRYTNVWIKGAKGWQMVVWQSTPIPAAAA